MEEFPEDAWAQLVSTADTISDPIPISTDKFTVGRSKGTDLCLAGNKLVSGKHCFIERDSSGTAWICDTSTNGTLLNLTKKLSHTKHKLEHGDEIHVVYRNTEPELNVSYLFQDLVKLKEEEQDATQEYSSDLDLDTTLENKDLDEMELETVQNTSKRQHEEEEADEDADTLPFKKQKTSELEVEDSKEDDSEKKETPSEKTMTEEEKPPEDADKKDKTPNVSEQKEAKHKGGKKGKKEKAAAAATKDTDKTDGVTPAESAEKGGKDGEEKDKRDEEKAEKKEEKKEVKEKGAAAASEQDAALEETLTCIICQEIMHNCVSLQPCLHSFCAGCYSEWMERSSECPSCRMEVERVKKSHMLNNLVEMFLSQHPEKKRSDEDLKKMEEKNKIKQDLVKPSSPTRDMSQEIDDHEGYDGYESPEDELGSPEGEGEGYSDSDQDDGGVKPNPYAPPGTAGAGAALFTGTYTLPKTICRQCPGGSDSGGMTSALSTAAGAVGGVAAKLVGFVTGKTTTDTNKPGTSALADNTAATGTAARTAAGTATAGTAAATDDGAKPSTSATGPTTGGDTVGKKMPTPPKFNCKAGQVHMLCQCCMEAMPDRRTDRTTDPTLPPQQCSMCFRMFCHAYWGCRRKLQCRGCIGKLKEMNFDPNCWTSLVLDNLYESTILKNYLTGKGISLQDFLTECCQKLDRGEYKLFVHGTVPTSERVVCYPCGLRCFGDLAYQYRKDIPAANLPVEVGLRQNCYWGRQCRSQKNRPHHAANFNHICEQTRKT